MASSLEIGQYRTPGGNDRRWQLRSSPATGLSATQPDKAMLSQRWAPPTPVQTCSQYASLNTRPDGEADLVPASHRVFRGISGPSELPSSR